VIGIQEDLHWKDSEKAGMDTPLLEPRSQAKEKAVGFIEAWRIPGVAPFALCLFFCKLVAYTFLYWLPFYISHTGSSEFYFCSYYRIVFVFVFVGKQYDARCNWNALGHHAWCSLTCYLASS
jgi:hypothetical protein